MVGCDKRLTHVERFHAKNRKHMGQTPSGRPGSHFASDIRITGSSLARLSPVRSASLNSFCFSFLISSRPSRLCKGQVELEPFLPCRALLPMATSAVEESIQEIGRHKCELCRNAALY